MDDSKMDAFNRKKSKKVKITVECGTEHFMGLDGRLKYCYEQRYPIQIA